MANIFKNPLVLAETVVGSVVDQRSVVLYEQQTFESAKTEIEQELLERTQGTFIYPTVEDFVKKRALKELYKGDEVPYLKEINGFAVYGVSYIDANVSITSDICDHPIENGTIISDASIRNPVSAEVTIAMPTAFYTTIYEQIKKDYEEKRKIMLLTKFGMHENMVISAMPYKLEHGTVDRAEIVLSLREIMEVTPEYITRQTSAPTPEISPEKALTSDDTDMQVIGQKRYNAAIDASLNILG